MTNPTATLLLLLILLPATSLPAFFCPLGTGERRHKPRHPPPGAFMPPRYSPSPRMIPPPPAPDPITDESGYLGRRAPRAAPAPTSTNPWRPDK